MRLSAHHDHRDYHPVACHAKVLLDGRELSLCIHADEEAGTVEYYRRDAAGKIMLAGDEAVIATAYGDVQIVIPDEHGHLLQEFPFDPIEVGN